MYSFIFDIGGVLVSYDFKKVIGILSEKTKCEYKSIEGLFQFDMLYRIETGRMSCDDFFRSHVRSAMPGISYEEWVQVFIDHYTVNPVGMELLKQLKGQGSKVYILSNLAEFHKIALEKKIPELFSICDKNFLSYELGFHKPEIEIYEQVYKDIGEKPEKCVFFDDVTDNVEGAEKAGMKGIHFSNGNIEAIRKRIKELEMG